MQQLQFAASEFSLPSAFETSQTVSSNEPLRVAATTTGGAGVGGYEVEVKQLANAAQRTYAFTPPVAEDKLTIGGRAYTLKAGGTAKELATSINSDGSATVYAAVTEANTVVLSSRATGAKSGEAITVADPGGALLEKAGTAKEGKDAEFTVDGVAGTATTNVVTTAIAGVSLTLLGLTPTGPVTIDVQAPAYNSEALEKKLQAFVTLYNSTVEAIDKQLTTKPPSTQAASASGSLFGDSQLSGLLRSMRQKMYEPIVGLPAGMASPFDVGLGTGAATGSAVPSQAAIEGQLKLEPAKLTSALQANAAGVKTMLEQWSKSIGPLLTAAAEPGGSIATRITGDETEITALKARIIQMNENLAVRQKALEQTYAQLEAIISKNTAQSSWLTTQSEQLARSTGK